MIDNKRIQLILTTPFYLGDNNELCFFGYLTKPHSTKAIIIDIIYNFEEQNLEKQKYYKANNLFYSYLYIEPLPSEYKSSYFKEMLED